MPSNSAEPTPGDPHGWAGAELRAAIEREEPALRRRIVWKIAQFGGFGPAVNDSDRATEVLDEAVRRLLAKANEFDTRRPVRPWLMSCALNILREQKRARRRERKAQGPRVELNEDLWQALSGPSPPPSHRAVDDRLDLQQALGRLDPQSRHVIECRFFQGLEGDDLAHALGVEKAGTARVRVTRAMQRLRAIVNDLTAPEVTP